ncbi:IS3 family transposase [Chromobacterium amazonense]|uniref:IS3 family transposase n=1 Tax=Chromobacterium amazonense TaxID=1382803 RepID=UPI003F794CDC
MQVRAAFEASGRCYGSRRIQSALAAQSIRIGRYRIRRLMREAACESAGSPSSSTPPTAITRCR